MPRAKGLDKAASGDPAGGSPADGRSGWSPLRFAAFRRWWLANLTSNIGSWMQTVAAEWGMTTVTTSAFLVGAIQATNLPVLLLAVPGGVLGDLLDRKKLIIAGQAVMLVSAAALGALDLAGLVSPAVLLILLCGVGVGQGLAGPIAQTLQPELVPPAERPQAIALGSVNQNLAPRDRTGDRRAVARCHQRRAGVLRQRCIVLGGDRRGRHRIGASTGPRAPSRARPLGDARRRPVRPQLPALLAIMIRAAAFGFFASGVWALLPLVARRKLGLGSGGYGLLLGAVGIGACWERPSRRRSTGRSRPAH
jgi:Transmembrane secretion effector